MSERLVYVQRKSATHAGLNLIFPTGNRRVDGRVPNLCIRGAAGVCTGQLRL